MKATFDNTVSILVKAYLNGTLEHGNYCACAVGNLIANAVNAQIVLGDTNTCSKYVWVHPKYKGDEWYSRLPDGKVQILCTGYSPGDIWDIEKAFESARWGNCTDDEKMFNGLMKVVEVLASIHSVDLTVKEQAKQLFVKV